MGYNKGSYQIYDIKIKQIITLQDVVFNKKQIILFIMAIKDQVNGDPLIQKMINQEASCFVLTKFLRLQMNLVFIIDNIDEFTFVDMSSTDDISSTDNISSNNETLVSIPLIPLSRILCSSTREV